MSPNDEVNQTMTRRLVEQLKLRPLNVLLNINALLEGESFRLKLVHLDGHQNPQEASPSDWKVPPEMEEGYEAVRH